MLRRAASSLLQLEPRIAASAGYATHSDYSLALKGAYDVSKDVVPVPEKEAGFATGAPMDTFARKARIYVPARTASQQGYAKTSHPAASSPQWKIEFDTTKKWENPLIGWTSTADTLENVGRASLFFNNKEEAMSFCDKHGWEYTVDEPNWRRTTRQKRYTGYGDNYSVKRHGIPDLSTLPSNRAAST